MSVKLICKPEFFHRRLNSQLGLNVAVEPGTTYFLCSGLEEVPALVSSQNAASLTALSGEKKVQILICKEKPNDVKISQTVVKLENDSTTLVAEESSSSKAVVQLKKEVKSSYVDRVKPSSTCTVTSTSDQDVGSKEEANSLSSCQSTVEAPVIKVPLYALSNVKSESPAISMNTCSQVQFTPSNNPLQGGSAMVNVGRGSNLPCLALRHELKQAILQRRMVQGKTMIDLSKEEHERQLAAQSMKMSDEEIEKMIKRRVSNNRAARKCREKRKLEEETLMKEMKRLMERKNALNEIISTLEQQQSFLRLWATGSEADDSASKEKIRCILNSEVKIPELPPRTEFKSEEDMNSIIISSSEYNSDDTRNGFEFDSSQETNDTTDLAELNYTEMSVKEIKDIVSDTFVQTKDNGVEKVERNFREIRAKSEDVKSNSDNDSDVELIEIDRPLVIDIN